MEETMKRTYVCITESLCCTTVINIIVQLYFNNKTLQRQSLFTIRMIDPRYKHKILQS